MAATEESIYNRLASAPQYHPSNASLFADWNMQAGDVVQIRSDDSVYDVPIYNLKLKWNGASKIDVESTGNPEREPLPALKRREYSSNSSNYAAQKSYGGGLGSALEKIANINGIMYAAGLQVDPVSGVLLYASEHGSDYALGSSFKVQSDAITQEVTRATATEGEAYTRIQTTADGLSAEAARASDAEGALSTRITVNAEGISTKVEKNGVISAINQSAEAVTINANRINLEGYVTATQFEAEQARLTDLMAGNASASRLVASSGNFSNLEVTNSLTYYSTNVGNVVASVGPASASGGQITIPWTKLDGTSGTAVTFNIADTQFYRDGVAAARPHSLSGITLGSSDTGTSTQTVTVFCADDEEIDLTTTIDASAVYTAGRGSMGVVVDTEAQTVKVAESGTKSLIISATAPTFTYSTSTHQYTATAKANAGNTEMHTASAVSGTEAYTDGQNSVTISNSDIVRDGEDDYNATTHNTTIYIEATASNGAQGTQSFVVSGADAYAAGASGGKALMGVTADTATQTVKVAESGTKSLAISATAPTFTYNTSTHTYTATAKAKAGSVEMHTASGTSGTEAYTAGQNSVTISNSDIVRDGTDDYNSTTHNTTIYIEATASNGAQGTQSFVVSGADAFSDGQGSVTITGVTGTQGTVSGTDISVSLTATASNNATGTGSITVDASAVYSAGQDNVAINKGAWNSGDISFTKSAGTASTKSVSLSLTPVQMTSTDPNKWTVTAYDGSSNTGASVIVDATSRYTAGETAGAAGVTIISVTGTPGSADANHIIPVALSATASNNATGTGSVNVNASGVYSDGESAGYTTGYSEGVNDGYDSVTVSSVVKYQADAYDTDTHNYAVYVRGTASNGKTRDNSLTVNGASAYNAGASSVSVSAGSITVTG